jgi:hypothetical protein
MKIHDHHARHQKYLVHGSYRILFYLWYIFKDSLTLPYIYIFTSSESISSNFITSNFISTLIMAFFVKSYVRFNLSKFGIFLNNSPFL